MSKSYVIQWKSTINGRTGKGTKIFDWEEARQLAEELNLEYPDILHEPAEIGPTAENTPGGRSPLPAAEPEQNEPAEAAELPEPVEQSQSGSETAQIMHDPDHALSFQ